MKENNAHLNGEIRGFYSDLESSKSTLASNQKNIAREFQNGLGKAMLEHLLNPPKPNRWYGLKLKIKRWLYKKGLTKSY